MPVMPARARAPMTALAVQRSTHSLVSVRKLSVGGCLICTATKMAPAAAAQMAAAWVRLRVVTVMAGSLFPVRAGCPGNVRDGRSVGQTRRKMRKAQGGLLLLRNRELIVAAYRRSLRRVE